jgi:hypothetical protein
MRQRRLSILFTAVVVLAGLCAHAAPHPVVGTCVSGTQYLTIQAAVDAASPGESVRVCPGTYPEQILITKPLTLKGVPNGTLSAAVIVPPGGGVSQNTSRLGSYSFWPVAAQVLVQGTSGVTISNLIVDGNNNGLPANYGVDPNCGPLLTGVYYQNASGTVDQVVARNQKVDPNCYNGFGILVESGSALTSTVTIQNSSIRAYGLVGIVTDFVGTNATIKGNSIAGLGLANVHFENGINLAKGATGKISGNSVLDNIDPNGFSSGILVNGPGVTVTGNVVGNNDNGIAIVEFNSVDNDIVTQNTVFRSVYGVDACSNKSSVQNNVITSSDVAAIFLDSSCSGPSPSGNNNTVRYNTINDACAGVLADPATTGNTVAGNSFSNVVNTVKSGTSCP